MKSDYDKLLDNIFSRGRYGIKPGLERITPLLHKLGDPQNSFRSIHVCGTNGKGSTSAFLSSILSASGFHTALFTSPHLQDYAERFRVDSVELSHDKIVKCAEKVLEAADSDATFFEITTALAALLFAEEGVEVAVMEAGMGGVNDATNVFSGIMTIVTPIALDHTDYLGKTLAQIARDKSGIIKPERAVISALQDVDVLEEISLEVKRKSARLFVENDAFKGFWNGDKLCYEGMSCSFDNLLPSIGGRYQSTNASLAIAASEMLEEAGLPITTDAIKRGVDSAVWRGRMQKIKGKPDVIIDGAHNPAGAEALSKELRFLKKRGTVILLGVMNDKDADGIVAPLAASADFFITVSPSVDRAASAEKVASIIQSHGKSAKAASTIESAFAEAVDYVGEQGLIVVCGSLYLAGEVLSLLSNSSCRQIRG